MEFRIKREPFLRELTLLQDVAGKNDNRPILACVKIEARDDELLLDATDADVSMGCICTSEHDGLSIEQDGIAVVNAKRLYSYIRGMESAEVTCATDTLNWLELRYPDRKEGKPLYRMPGFPIDDFPAIPEAPESDSGDWKMSSIPAPAFADMAQRAEYAIAGDRGSISIQGALLNFDTDASRMIATDGNKLIVAARKGGVASPWSVAIPRRALASIASMCRSLQLGGAVEITRGPNRIFAFAGGRMLSGTLLAAQFPAWQTIVKGLRLVKFAALDTKCFKACAERAAAVLDAKGVGGLKLQFSASGILRFNAQSSLFGEAEEQMEIGYKLDEKVAANMADKDLTVRLSHVYLLGFLATAQAEVMKIAGSDAALPVKLVDGDLEADGFQVDCIIMSINEAVAAQAMEIAAATEKPKAQEAASAVAGAAEKPRRARGKR